jgi:ribosomal protein S7
MESMTGYGRATARLDGREMTIEMKAVNHRFLDLAFRAPKNLSFLEEPLRSLIQKNGVSRGHVEVFITYVNQREDAKVVTVDESALTVFNQAIANIMPAMEVKARRVGGSTYQVPIEIRPERRQTLALRWLVMFARKRGERSMADRLAGEIMDAANNTGNAVKRREDMHKMAEANKAFAHYRW